MFPPCLDNRKETGGFLLEGNVHAHGEKVDKFLLQNARFDAISKNIDDEMKGSGIYCIANKINGHKYIGQSKNIKNRKHGHYYCLRNGVHTNPYLQNAWNCYGEPNFSFIVLEYCEENKLDEKEQEWIDRLRSVYNIAKDVKLWREYFARDSLPDGSYIKQGETFIRPSWHLWVYGGEKNPSL